MTIDDIALGHEIGAPHRVQDLLPRDNAPATAGKHVQEALLDAAEVDDRAAGPHFAVEDVDFHLPDLDRRDHGSVDAGCTARDHDRSCQQLLRREWHRHNIVNAELESLQLGGQVTAPRETEDRDPALGERVRGTEVHEQVTAVVMVHVDNCDVRLPHVEDGLNFCEVRRRPDEKDPVIQRQLDEVHDDGPVEQNQRTARIRINRARGGDGHLGTSARTVMSRVSPPIVLSSVARSRWCRAAGACRRSMTNPS